MVGLRYEDGRVEMRVQAVVGLVAVWAEVVDLCAAVQYIYNISSSSQSVL